MHAVFGFVEDLGILRLEHLVRNLKSASILRDVRIKVVERRQTVEEHEFAVDVTRSAHKIHIDLIGAEHLDAFSRLRLLAHRNPNVGVKDVRALHALYGIVENADVDAVALCDLLCLGKNGLVRPEFLRRTADVSYARLGAAHHKRIGDVVAAVADVRDRALLK